MNDKLVVHRLPLACAEDVATVGGRLTWKRPLGSIVLAEDVPKEGWYESVVREVMAEGLFRLTWQYWPGEVAFVRKVGQLAL